MKTDRYEIYHVQEALTASDVKTGEDSEQVTSNPVVNQTPRHNSQCHE